ncbi:tyrosyl-DNA phosphodiesterase 1 [Marchantia polymorpha subsp. ruderalis]|uniref:PNK FHA domain-containing protein n=1 Tax=Marchantia polymorpha TaxID=3197 RepID=A0A2R6W8I3_MARPO|nr:hypothetical protein MARPO_0129s0047 [Marchantia polymorpha]BBN01781.1 hypothetical protein Mp_2g10240 [Marchantia polymorpha subsp. ruderalis]|eukprot:PTQ30163.1 hypothetical protein MARPO_0129s0047 [Marchantia polymorpha]
MASAQDSVAFLTALSTDGSVDGSVPPLAVYTGENIFGRDDCHVFGKKISRKHLRLTAWSDEREDHFDVYVLGPNPVEVFSGRGKVKVKPKECCVIGDTDVIYFLPNDLPFRLNVCHRKECSTVSNTVVETTHRTITRVISTSVPSAVSKDVNNSGVKKRHLADDEGAWNQLKEEINWHRNDANAGTVPMIASGRSLKPVEIPASKLRRTKFSLNFPPSSFHLLHTTGLPQSANSGCVRLQDVIEGDVQVAILSNYMVDVDWILSECPLLRRIPVIMIHGERGGSLDLLNNRKSKNWVLYQPPLPISFGTHHSKAMLLLYETGLRVVVHTANLIHADWNNKTQGLWMQDFPRKTSLTHRVSSGFEEDLVEYLTHLKWEGYTTSLPSTGPIKVNAQFFRTFDFSSATVRLVASVPGYHRDRDISKFGHMKMLQLLKDERFDSDFVRSPLVFQFSSLGSINEQWIDEMRSSMSAGKTTSGDDLGIGEVSFVWPTVEDIRCSLEGYAAGNSVPSPQKNVKAVQKSYWAKWRADHCGRGRAMPHIKTYARYNGQTLAWFLLTSSNLSKAAWGSLQKQNSQLMIRSYELGVLFLPSTVQRAVGSTFSCTGNAHSKEIGRAEASTFSENEYQQLRGRPGRLVTTNWEDDPSFEPFARLPVPYSLPPPRYGPRDVPWSWDCVYTKPDIFGEVWPRDVQFYAAQGPM